MENRLHLYLCKLRIISKIPVGGKLDISYNDINIYYGGFVGWIYRKISGDSKDNAAKYLIELYKEINEFSDQLMYNIQTETNNIIVIKKTNMLVSLTEKLKESLTGILNLIDTYKHYLKIVSLFECLEHDVIIPQYKTLLNFIPVIYHTNILKNPIKYSQLYNYPNPLYINNTSKQVDLKISTPIDILKSNEVKTIYASSAPIDIPNTRILI